MTIRLFRYPMVPHTHRYSPPKYRRYQSYKKWLRDEFHFTCIFCGKRESFCGHRGENAFSVEHLRPRSQFKNLACDYGNLIYSCLDCNSNKGDVWPIPDPFVVAYGSLMSVREDGTIIGHTSVGCNLILLLKLDDPELTQWRKRHLKMAKLIAANPTCAWSATILAFFSYPSKLPSLRGKRTKVSDGSDGCYFEQRKQGVLPDRY